MLEYMGEVLNWTGEANICCDLFSILMNGVSRVVRVVGVELIG